MPIDYPIDKIHAAVLEIIEEVYRACSKHKSYNSPHEAYAVILEELDEYWELVRSDRARSPEGYSELKQIAATAIRAMIDVTPPMGELRMFSAFLSSNDCELLIDCLQCYAVDQGRDSTDRENELIAIELMSQGSSLSETCAQLDQAGIPTVKGGPWAKATVRRVWEREKRQSRGSEKTMICQTEYHQADNPTTSQAPCMSIWDIGREVEEIVVRLGELRKLCDENEWEAIRGLVDGRSGGSSYLQEGNLE